MRHPLTCAVVFAAMLACSPFAFAAPARQAAPSGAAAPVSGQPQPTRQPEALFDQLGLTDSQRSQVNQLIQQNFQQARPEMQTLRQKRMAFDNAIPGSSPFQAAANDLAQAESNVARAQVLRQADLRTKVYNLLTAEQRTKLASVIQQRQQEMQQRAATPATSH